MANHRGKLSPNFALISSGGCDALNQQYIFQAISGAILATQFNNISDKFRFTCIGVS